MSNPNDTRHIQGGDQGPLSVPDSSLQPGQVLQNRYRILGIIGMGGMGAVYQARDLNFPNVPKLVAVKEIINLAQDQQLRETTMKNFEREAEILAVLSHPSIPQIYDFFSFGDRAYLVMEFIQGKDLEAILNSTDSFLPVEQVRQWAIELCDVLSYLHSHEPDPVVFRDMKPSNVMIDHHRRIRLIDFGIAKTFQMGQPGTMIGTDGYAAPEQYKGIATPATDVYALGATLHHLLTKQDPRLEPPFSFDKRPIRDYNSNVPEPMAAVIMRSVRYEAEERYNTADAMKQSLEAAGSGISPVVPVMPQEGNPNQQVAPAVQPQQIVQQPVQPSPPAGASGTAPRSAQQISSVAPIWDFQVEDAVRSTPLVRDGVVYVSSYDNNVWALNAQDGSLKWKCATEGGLGSSPAYGGGVIYIGSSDTRLYAIDARTGNRKWTFKTEGRIYSTPAVTSGMVFFGSDDGTIYAVKPSPTSGREIWAFNLMSAIRSSPVVFNDFLFFGTETGEFVSMNLSGELQWRFETRRRVMATACVHDDMVYIGSDDYTFYALDIERGYQNWRFRTKGSIVSSAAYFDGMVYFGSADGNVYALEALGGKEVWQYDIGEAVTSSPAVYRDVVYIGAADGAVYSLHAKTGELLWRFQSQGPIISSPSVADDMVYIGSDDKRIYALQA